MAKVAARLQFSGIEAATVTLVKALGPEGTTPDPSYGPAVFALSDAEDEATRLIGHGWDRSSASLGFLGVRPASSGITVILRRPG